MMIKNALAKFNLTNKDEESVLDVFELMANDIFWHHIANNDKRQWQQKLKHELNEARKKYAQQQQQRMQGQQQQQKRQRAVRFEPYERGEQVRNQIEIIDLTQDDEEIEGVERYFLGGIMNEQAILDAVNEINELEKIFGPKQGLGKRR